MKILRRRSKLYSPGNPSSKLAKLLEKKWLFQTGHSLQQFCSWNSAVSFQMEREVVFRHGAGEVWGISTERPGETHAEQGTIRTTPKTKKKEKKSNLQLWRKLVPEEYCVSKTWLRWKAVAGGWTCRASSLCQSNLDGGPVSQGPNSFLTSHKRTKNL